VAGADRDRGVEFGKHRQRIGVAVVQPQQLGQQVAGGPVAAVEREGAAGAGDGVVAAQQLALRACEVQPVQRHAGRQPGGALEVCCRLLLATLARQRDALRPQLVGGSAAALGHVLRTGDAQSGAGRDRR
jgi:hypothetical protein